MDAQELTIAGAVGFVIESIYEKHAHQVPEVLRPWGPSIAALGGFTFQGLAEGLTLSQALSAGFMKAVVASATAHGVHNSPLTSADRVSPAAEPKPEVKP